MSGLILWGILTAAIVGITVKLILDMQKNDLEITWGEYGLGLVVISMVLVPLITWAGWSVSKSSNLTFNEYRNGWELEAVATPIQCTRDGPCWHEYACDPYIVMVPYPCGTSKAPRTCLRPETRYHDCPYVTVETTYSVRTTIGDHTIAAHIFPLNPDQHRWRASHSVPSHVIQRVGVGAPPFWSAVDARVRAGKPGPATMRESYDNYILASDSTILTQYSNIVEKLLGKEMLPPLTSAVFNFYMANKVYWAHGKISREELLSLVPWSEKLAYANAALGSEMQGDLHIVLVKDSDLAKAGSNPDEYALALKAYWQNPKYFQKNALSKNAIVVVVGTSDGQSVSWARAMTGMPLGNERLITEVRNTFAGTPFTPEAVIGGIRGYFEVYAQKVKSSHEAKGRLGSIVWGKDSRETRFQRVRMSSKDSDGDVGPGFEYLANEIQLTGFQFGMILFLSFLGSGGVWFAAAAHGIRDRRYYAGPFDLNRMGFYWKEQWKEMQFWLHSQKVALVNKLSRGGRDV